jgi:hypothetical protein
MVFPVEVAMIPNFLLLRDLGCETWNIADWQRCDRSQPGPVDVQLPNAVSAAPDAYVDGHRPYFLSRSL